MSDLRELHLLGRGGPSDAGATFNPGVILNMCFQFNPTKIPILFSFLNQLPFYSYSWGWVFLPSDESRNLLLAGLTYLARCCQKLQHLTLLGGSSSAASSLLLQVSKRGTDSSGRLPHISWKWFGGIIFGIHLAIWKRHEGES